METSQQPSNKSSSRSSDDDLPKESHRIYGSDEDHPGMLEQTPSFYRGFWCPKPALKLLQSAETRLFQARDTDILVASKPKSGTTWFKALIFTILNRSKYPMIDGGSSNNCLPSNPSSGGHSQKLPSSHPLLTANPHELVRSLEFQILNYKDPYWSSISNSPLPRLYSTHLPFHVLPEPIKTSGCKIVYACRNPLDTIVSLWKFAQNGGETEEESSQKLEHIVDLFCKGGEVYGPHWDHVSGYWKESLDKPDKVLFMTYEEMKENSISGIKKLAVFMGYPFSLEEEEMGVMEGIVEMCSLGSLKSMKVNKTGRFSPFKPNNKFFRKGEVGGWVNQLSPSTADRVRKVMQEKFQDVGAPVMENLYPVPTTIG